MKGYIKIEAMPDGIQCEVNLENLNVLDRFLFLYSVSRALDLGAEELQAFTSLVSMKFFERDSTEYFIRMEPGVLEEDESNES